MLIRLYWQASWSWSAPCILMFRHELLIGKDSRRLRVEPQVPVHNFLSLNAHQGCTLGKSLSLYTLHSYLPFLCVCLLRNHNDSALHFHKRWLVTQVTWFFFDNLWTAHSQTCNGHLWDVPCRGGIVTMALGYCFKRQEIESQPQWLRFSQGKVLRSVYYMMWPKFRAFHCGVCEIISRWDVQLCKLLHMWNAQPL